MTSLWRLLAELVGSFVFGLGASILPVFNNEAYVLASQATGVARWWTVGIGLGLGNGIGKTVVVLLLRQGRRLPWGRRISPTSEPTPGEGRWRRWGRQLLALVGDPRWGVPVVALSAATSLPPNYPVTVVAAASRMRWWWFAIADTTGAVVRMVALCLVGAGIFG